MVVSMTPKEEKKKIWPLPFFEALVCLCGGVVWGWSVLGVGCVICAFVRGTIIAQRCPAGPIAARDWVPTGNGRSGDRMNWAGRSEASIRNLVRQNSCTIIAQKCPALLSQLETRFQREVVGVAIGWTLPVVAKLRLDCRAQKLGHDYGAKVSRAPIGARDLVPTANGRGGDRMNWAGRSEASTRLPCAQTRARL